MKWKSQLWQFKRCTYEAPTRGEVLWWTRLEPTKLSGDTVREVVLDCVETYEGAPHSPQILIRPAHCAKYQAKDPFAPVRSPLNLKTTIALSTMSI